MYFYLYLYFSYIISTFNGWKLHLIHALRLLLMLYSFGWLLPQYYLTRCLYFYPKILLNLNIKCISCLFDYNYVQSHNLFRYSVLCWPLTHLFSCLEESVDPPPPPSNCLSKRYDIIDLWSLFEKGGESEVSRGCERSCKSCVNLPVCVCVCVCVRERDTEVEPDHTSQPDFLRCVWVTQVYILRAFDHKHSAFNMRTKQLHMKQ